MCQLVLKLRRLLSVFYEIQLQVVVFVRKGQYSEECIPTCQIKDSVSLRWLQPEPGLPAL